MNRISQALTLSLLLGFVGALHAETLKTPTRAPAWTLKDVEGHDVSFAQFKGKVVVIDFWATWCIPCREEIPGYIALQEKYRADGLVFVGISVDRQGPRVVKKFIAEHHVNYQMVMADDDVLGAFGGSDGFPTTFVIDRDGNIRERKVGVEDTASFERTLLKYLK